jgi:Zn finger protein HypA/HybF involved in hydrogenase expression
LQTEKELTIPDIEQEIECPRCNDIMALSSDFDRLYYFCEECNLSLLVN